MSRCFNKVILIGFVASEPEYRKSGNGTSILTFRIALSESFKTSDGRIVDRDDWFSIVAWRNLADVSKKILKKGSKVFVEGVLRSRTIQFRSGERVQKVEIIAENIILLEGKKARNNRDKEALDIWNVGDDIELSDFYEEVD